MKIIKLCHPGTCCPKLIVPSKDDISFADEDIFVLRDDNEGKVELTWVQLQELRNTINKL